MASSSSVRLFATASLLVMLFMASGMGIMAAGPRMCSSKSEKFRGACIFANGNCNTVCKSEGFSSGTCTGSFPPICTCTKPCC
ncbi:defensin Ec-AMP-D1-like [Ipomoea triloba]|uniref:defensin Ec-AMP-D1-like n=1 Tax=Ipomoea triloba TaxID=35885 RepID=UPI00125DD4F3|nr:defensin Ec-AMP-D1-like [Ipomoea triloba]